MQCIICGLALVVLSIFVSRTTVAITKLYTLKEEYERRFAKMRKFLLQNKIPKELNHRIDVYLKARINLQKWRVEESKVVNTAGTKTPSSVVAVSFHWVEG